MATDLTKTVTDKVGLLNIYEYISTNACPINPIKPPTKKEVITLLKTFSFGVCLFTKSKYFFFSILSPKIIM